jgi:hypothetical protein
MPDLRVPRRRVMLGWRLANTINPWMDRVSVGRSTSARRRLFATIGCLIGMAMTAAGCTADHVELEPTAPRTVVVTSVPATAGTCDDSGFLAIYAPFASDFDAGRRIDVDLFFAASPHFDLWWDPSDASWSAQGRPDLAAHFHSMYALGVRLPKTVTFTGTGNPGVVNWNDHHGFAGGGQIDCVTGKITYFIIDSWSKAIAGRAPAASG